MAEPMLSVYNINVWYGAIHAIKDISFNVNEGEIVALIGANGAGKSTTLKTVSGLLRSKTGSIKFMGEDITHTPADKLVGKGLAQVPEGRRAFLQMTVEENLEMGAYTQPKSTVAPGLERVYEQFPRLKERRRQVAGTLSGGEQQMLVMGRALMSNPKLLMLDEPSMGLAPILIEQIFQIVEDLHKAGTTVLLGRAERADGALDRHARLRARDRQDHHDRARAKSSCTTITSARLTSVASQSNKRALTIPVSAPFLSCGEIGTNWGFQTPKQSLFHRNFIGACDDDRPKLAPLHQSQGPVPECAGTGPWWLGSIGFCLLVYLLSACETELGFGYERGSAVTAEAGRLGRSCLHGRCCGRYGVLLGALLATVLLALRFRRCGCHAVCRPRALLADAKDNDRATDDKDDRHATANNKRQVSLDKIQHILRQGMGDVRFVDVHMKHVIALISRQYFSVAIHE